MNTRAEFPKETGRTGEFIRLYHQTHRKINPTGLVPCGPAIDFNSPHNRSTRLAVAR